MTITNTTRRIAYTGDGSTVSLPIPFVWINDADISVVSTVITTGVSTTLTISTHYTLSGGNFANGTLTVVDPATDFPATVRWTIVRTTPAAQPQDYTTNDPFSAESHEQGLDRAAMRDAEQNDDFDRSLRYPADDPATLNSVLPNSVDRANGFIQFDANGEPTVVTDVLPGTATVSPFGQTLIDAVDAAAGRVIMDSLQDVFTTRGQILYEGAAGELALNKGPVGTVLVAGANDPAWDYATPPGWISGLGITRAGANLDQVTIGAGVAAADNLLAPFPLRNSTSFTKDLTATWASGTGNGGRPTAVAWSGSSDYHVFAIQRDTDNVVDFGIDTSIDAVALLVDPAVALWAGANPPRYRRLGGIHTGTGATGGTADILDFVQRGGSTFLVTDRDDAFYFNDQSGAGTNDFTSGALVTIPGIPTGLPLEAIFRVRIFDAAVTHRFTISCPDVDNVAPSAAAAPLLSGQTLAATPYNGTFRVWTNISAQVRLRTDGTNIDEILFSTLGWVDTRDKEVG